MSVRSAGVMNPGGESTLRFRLSLRRLLVLVAVFCVFFAWIAVRLQVARSVAAVESMGVLLRFNDAEDDSIRCRVGRFVGLSNAIAAIGVKSDEATRHIRKLEKLQMLVVMGDVTNDGLRQLADLRQLEVLSISAPQVTNEGLNHLVGLTQVESLRLRDSQYLKQLPQLTTLNLPYCKFSANSLGGMTELISLKQLSLRGSHLTDAGVEHLGALAALESLDLAGTDITDDAVIQLKKLSRLKYLGIRDTDVTRDGADTLQQALPQCRIESGLSASIKGEPIQ